ncbi:hypothetical protein [Micromonospora endolithica]|uniref:hypothetical protein n=1 Tax=Micromonospora endolithica TaxID=230091 RepID=UPI0011BD9393|nr:hypothetical protein [Micromonospora endolithica]
MGSTGDPRRVVDMTAWRTRDEAEKAIFAGVDGWYDTRRIQACRISHTRSGVRHRGRRALRA